MTARACHRTVLALPWLLNGSLETVERRAVREHLIGCAACRAELVRTREVLAAVQAGRAAMPAEPAATAAAAGRVSLFRRAATSRQTHRLAWAAMIAALVISAGNVWLAVRRAERQLTAESRRTGAAPVQATESAKATPPAAPVSVSAPAPTMAAIPVPAPAEGQPAFEPPRARRSSSKASPSTSRPTSAETISVTDFEGGSLASFDTANQPASPTRARQVPQPSSSSIFSGGFENGDLGEWQKETSPRGESKR